MAAACCVFSSRGREHSLHHNIGRVLVILCLVQCLPALTLAGEAKKTTPIAPVQTGDSSTILPYTPIQPFPEIVSGCDAFLDAFSKTAASYSMCAIKHSRPLSFCRHCVQEYLEANSTFNSLMEDVIKDETGTKCKDIILNSDRIQIVMRTRTFITTLWADSRCNHCFDYPEDKNGTAVAVLTNDTRHFSELMRVTTECFENYTTGYIPSYAKNHSVNHKVCQECANYYDAVNHFYEKLDKLSGHNICMDIVDVMNRTRIMWSQTFQCRKEKGDIVAVLSLSVFFCLMPIIFYIGNKIYGAKVEKEILKQKRLRDVASINSAS